MSMNTITSNAISFDEVYKHVSTILSKKLVPFVEGQPGVGKSQLFQLFAKTNNLKFIDCRLTQYEPPDINGFPDIDRERGRSQYLPMDTFPLDDEELPIEYDEEGEVSHEYNGWLILLDELPDAPDATKTAAYQLILDRKIGQRHLHTDCYVAAAGNGTQHGAMAQEMGTALRSRMIHLELGVNFEGWLNWASENNIDYRLISFINYKPEHLDTFQSQLDDKTFSCGRTLEMLSKVLENKPELEFSDASLINGCVSVAVGTDFYSFCQLAHKLPSLEEIEKNPKGVELPGSDEPGQQWFISGFLAQHISKDNVKELLTCMKRLPIEFQAMCVKEIVSKKSKDIIRHSAMKQWLKETGRYMFKRN